MWVCVCVCVSCFPSLCFIPCSPSLSCLSMFPSPSCLCIPLSLVLPCPLSHLPFLHSCVQLVCQTCIPSFSVLLWQSRISCVPHVSISLITLLCILVLCRHLFIVGSSANHPCVSLGHEFKNFQFFLEFIFSQFSFASSLPGYVVIYISICFWP